MAGICFRTRVDPPDLWLNFGRMSLTLDHSSEAGGLTRVRGLAPQLWLQDLGGFDL